MTTERKPHKWAEAIKAWADGKPVQYKNLKVSDEWVDYEVVGDQMPMFFGSSYFEWRVKPENTIVERNIWLLDNEEVIKVSAGGMPNVRFTFDPDTKKLVKAEVIR